MPKEIIIEGYTPEEILALPNEQLDALVLSGEALVFRAGTAQILESSASSKIDLKSSSPRSTAGAKPF